MSELSESGSNRSEMSEGSVDPEEEQRMIDFKKQVKRMLLLPDLIKVDNAPLKEKKEELKALQENIKQFMLENETDTVKISNAETLVLVTVPKQETTKKEHYERGLRKFCQKRGIEFIEGENGTVDEYFNDVNEEREHTTKHVLKRVKRGGRGKKKQ